MQQLKDKIVLVPFADWAQHGGQLVVQGAQPAEPVDPGHEIAVPGDQPGVGERGAGSRLGFLSGCWRIVGLAAARSHIWFLRGISLWLGSEESWTSWLILLVGEHVQRGGLLLNTAGNRFGPLPTSMVTAAKILVTALANRIIQA